jgi:hypothetical protein
MSFRESNHKIKTIISIGQNSFYLPLNQLSSSKIINDDKWMYVTWAFSMLHFANDTFSFDVLSNVINGKNYSKSNKKGILNFLTKKQIDSYEVDGDLGMIGLKLISNENETRYPDFIKELKREKIIKNYKWSIKYNYINRNYFEGEFLIGEEIEKYYKNDKGNDYDEFRMVKAHNRKYGLYWDIKLKEILIGDNVLNTQSGYSLQATFEPKLNLIIGTSDFKNAIYNRYFNNYISKEQCFEETMIFSYDYYIGITCRKPFNTNDFPNISFNLQFFSFIFTNKDLFYEDEDEFNFLIIFKKDNHFEGQDNQYWTFGIPFMSKYFFIFDNDQKMINYYCKNCLNTIDIKDENNNNNDNENNDNKDKNNDNKHIKNNVVNSSRVYIYVIIFGIIIGCVLILLGMKIQKFIIKRRFPTLNLNGRKKHKNELSCELEQMNRDNNLLASQWKD